MCILEMRAHNGDLVLKNEKKNYSIPLIFWTIFSWCGFCDQSYSKHSVDNSL